jgi:sugar phosphate permease
MKYVELNDLAEEKRTRSYAWIVWGVMVIAYAIKFFHSLSMGVVKDDLILEFGLSETSFVSIGNVFFYIYLVMQIPTGLLVDTLGPRLVASAGTLIAAVGILLFSFSSQVLILYIGRGLVGLGTSVVFVSILKIQANWFKESEFGTMTGITCFIGTLGGAVAQAPLALLVSYAGWRSAFRLIGFISLIVGLVMYVFIRNKPQDKGLISFNKENLDVVHSKGNIMKGLWEVIKNPRTWPLFFMYAGYYGTYVVMMGYYGSSFLSSLYNMSIVKASYYIIAGVMGSAIGSVVVGSVSDRMKSRKKPLIIVGGLYVIAWASMIFYQGGSMPEILLAPMLFVIGFTSCAYVISWPTVKEVNHPSYVGVSVSVANIGGFFGTIVLPPLVANVFVKYGDTLSSAELYHKAFMIVLVAAAIGFFASLFTKETGCKNIYFENNKEVA